MIYIRGILALLVLATIVFIAMGFYSFDRDYRVISAVSPKWSSYGFNERREPSLNSAYHLPYAVFKTRDTNIKKINDVNKPDARSPEIKELFSKIDALEQQKSQAAYDLELLSHIQVIDPEFYWGAHDYIEKPIIDFKVENKTNSALLSATFHGKITSPAQSVTYMSERFEHIFETPVLPGETRHLKITPNIFGDWVLLLRQKNDDITLQIDVRNAHDLRSRPLVGSHFSAAEQDQLETLFALAAEIEE